MQLCDTSDWIYCTTDQYKLLQTCVTKHECSHCGSVLWSFPRHVTGLSVSETPRTTKKSFRVHVQDVHVTNPTCVLFARQPSKARSDCKELKMLCAEDEQSRTCWMTAFRLLKVRHSRPRVANVNSFVGAWKLE